jgi:hypothetical protein
MTQMPEKPKLTPAYASFKSFNTFFEARRDDGHITTVVDRSLMSNFAGSTAGELLASMKYLGMIDDKGTPSHLYEQYLLADDEARVPLLASTLRRSYPYLFETERFDIERATSQQVVELFRAQGISGSTLSRSIMFFLAAAKQAGIKVSPNIRAPSMTARNGSSKVKKESAPPPAPTLLAVAPADRSPPPLKDVQVFEIPIPIGRKVTISIPNQFSSADWELFQTMLTAYVQHWKAQMADMQKSPATEKGDDGEL